MAAARNKYTHIDFNTIIGENFFNKNKYKFLFDKTIIFCQLHKVYYKRMSYFFIIYLTNFIIRLIPQSGINQEKVNVTQTAINYPTFTETDCSLSCSQE